MTTAINQRLLSYRISALLIIAISLFLPNHASGETLPEIKIGPPGEWIKSVKIQPALNIPMDKIQEGQYFLLVDRQIRVAQDKRPTQYYEHFAVQVANEAGMESASQISVVFDPGYETLCFHKLIVRRNAKKINKLGRTKIQLLRREKNRESLMYDGSYTADIIIDDVRVGDIIEYAYTLSGDNPIYDNIFSYKLDTSWSVPVFKNHFLLWWPKNRNLYQKSHNTDLKLHKQNRQNYTIYSLVHKNTKPIRRNTQTPTWHQRYGIIQMSESAAWSDVVAWALPLYRPAYANHPKIKALARKISKKGKTDEEKVICLLNYVQNEIRYLGIEKGINSHKPSPPDETINRRYGDCKDKTVVLISLLTSLGYEAYPCLVHSKLQRQVKTYHPTIHAFDHVITRASINGKRYWLDPTDRYQGQNLKKLFQPDYGVALVIAPEESSLTSFGSNDHLVGIHTKETFDLRGPMEQAVPYHSITLHEGLDAQNMRNRIAQDGTLSLQNKFLNFYAKYYQKIEIKAPIKVTDSPEKNELRIKESYDIKDFWKKKDKKREWECNFYTNTLYHYLRKPKQRQRHEPFRIRHPVNVYQTTTVLLPTPWNVSTFNFTEQNKHFKLTARATYNEKKQILNLDYHYRSFKDAVHPDELAGYMAALDRVDDELDFYLVKPYATAQAPSSKPSPFRWILKRWETILTFMLIGLVVFIACYCTVEWIVDMTFSGPQEPGPFFPVSLAKLILLSIVTVGIYDIYWFYKNWKYIKQRDDSSIMPFWRAFLFPIWFFPFYRQLKNDSQQRFGRSLLPGIGWMILLFILYVGASVINNLGNLYNIISLLSILCLLPFGNYILFINRHRPQTVKHHSKIRPRHFLMGTVLAGSILYSISSIMYWIPNAEVVKGHELPKWDIKFMQRVGLLDRNTRLIYFYSDALWSTRLDGNGVTSRNVFSYWRDDKSGTLQMTTAAYENIQNISVAYADSGSRKTIITVKPKKGSEFLLFASNEDGKDKLFVEAIRKRLTP